MKWAIGIIGGLLGIVVLMVTLSGFGILSNFLGIGGEVTDTQRMIGTYEDFYQDCATYNSLTRQQRNLERSRDNAAEEDKSRIQSQVVGVQNQRARVAEKYDAEAQQRTTSWLRENSLPISLADHLDRDELAECE